MYVEYLIKKRCYCTKGVLGDIIDAYFEDKYISDAVIIEAITEYNNLFKMFCMKDPDYVMKITSIWITLNESEGAEKRIYFIDNSGTKETKKFKYCQPFVLRFRYIHKVEDHNNHRHDPIPL